MNKKFMEYFSYVVLILCLTCVFAFGEYRNKKIIKTNEALENKCKQEAVKEKQVESNMTFYEKIKQKKNVSALVIGDGIAGGTGASTTNGIWYNKLSKYIQEKHNTSLKVDSIASPKNTALNAWIDSGSEDYSKYDAVFLILGQDDVAFEKIDQFQEFYEGIIRQVIKKNPKVEIIPVIENSIRKDNDYTKAIKDISEHYKLQYIDVRPGFASSKLAYKDLTKDQILPNDKGNEIYFDVIKNLIDKNVDDGKKVQNDLPGDALYKSAAKLEVCNVIKTPEKSNGFSSGSDGYLGKNAGDSLTYKVSGDVVLLSYITQKNGGNIRLLADGKPVKIITTADTAEHKSAALISDTLTSGNHDVEIEVQKGNNVQVKIIGVAVNK